MLNRIVEIAEDGRHLALERGFLKIQSEGKTLGRIALDDIAAVIANGHGLTMSANVLTALARRGAAFVLCGANHTPAGYLLSPDGHHLQAARMDAQMAARKPLRHRLWRELVRSKISNQAAVLRALGRPSAPVAALATKVRAGDPANIEAQAARRYWPYAFGDDFRRERTAEGINAMLNYTYTILRAATVRSIMAAGLHPSLALHHSRGTNPMRLADDLIEPFRPLADATVLGLLQGGKNSVTRETKPLLARVVFFDMEGDLGVSPLIICMQRLAVSLAQIFLGECRHLDLPRPLPLVLGRMLSGDSDF